MRTQAIPWKRRRLVSVVCCFGLFATCQASLNAAPAERTEPILIRQTPLLSPKVMIGLGLAPELQLEIEIDDRGFVQNVATTQIRPSTEHDEALKLDIAEQLSRWRFAPAREDGAPVAATLELMVQYRESLGSIDALSNSERNTIFFGNPEQQTETLLRLPAKERKEVLDRYSKEALENLDPTRVRRAESPRFVVLSDAEDERVPEVLARNLEAVYATFLEVFGEDIELQPESYKIVAFLFASKEDFHATQTALRVTTLSAGFYRAPGFLAFHQEGASDQILSIMIHEAFHAFSDRKLRKPGPNDLRWFEEGMADYFGNSEVRKGRLEPGKTITRQFVLHYGRVLKTKTQAGFTLPVLKRAIREGEAPTLKQLFVLSRQEFYGDNIQLNYGTSWLFIHFLRHGNPSWTHEQFPKLALYLYEGYPSELALETVYGMSADMLQTAFVEYARSF